MKVPRYLIAFVVLAAAGVGAAQVRLTQSGRALDASYLIGSGGINTVRRANRPFNANLYVTGQVAGGFYFHGTQPYAGANQLRLDLPSAGLDNFVRGSVGLQQVAGGISYGPVRYLSPYRTVLSAGAIASGLNAPGTSIPRATYLPATSARRLYDSAVKAYQPVLPDMGRELWVNPLIQPTPAGQPTQGAAVTTTLRSDLGAVRPAASTLFGILHKSDRQRLVDELTAAELARRDRQVDPRVDTRIQAAPTEAEPPKTDETAAEAQPTPPTPARDQTHQPGQDVLLDVLLMLDKMRQEEAERPAQPGAGGVTRPDEAGVARPAQAVRQIRDQIVLVRLAGKGRDMFNINMSRAEKALTEGKYYEAARYCEIAGILNSANSLAPLLETLSLFAANEPFSAAFRLRRAMRRFPPLMGAEVVPDVNLILGRHVVELRISQIEQRLAESDESPEPSLLFLAAFVRSSMRQRDKAAAHARRLKALAEQQITELQNRLKTTGDKPGQDIHGLKSELATNKIYRLYAEHLLKTAPQRKTPTTAKGF